MRNHKTQAGEVVAKKENWVTVRVWLTKVKRMPAHIIDFIQTLRSGEEGQVGHVSLETAKMYASHWPMACAESPFLAVDSDAYTKELDIQEEEGDADFKMTLYSLDVEKINEAIQRIIERKPEWVLIGDQQGGTKAEVSSAGLSAVSMESGSMESLLKLIGRIVFSKAPVQTKNGPVFLLRAHSCASLVMGLLGVGGIIKLDPGYTQLMDLTIKTPNNMAHYVQEMRKREIKQYPYSQKWAEGDRPLPSKKCTIS
jgi:hypothetical protein